MIFKQRLIFVLLFSLSIGLNVCAIAEQMSVHVIDKGVGVSSNPSPADHIGTGELFKQLGLNEEKTGLSYIPKPGAVAGLPQTWAASVRVLALF